MPNNSASSGTDSITPLNSYRLSTQPREQWITRSLDGLNFLSHAAHERRSSDRDAAEHFLEQ